MFCQIIPNQRYAITNLQLIRYNVRGKKFVLENVEEKILRQISDKKSHQAPWNFCHKVKILGNKSLQAGP